MSGPPPAPSAQASGTGVRRHHTISAASRTRDAGRNTIAEEAAPQPDHGVDEPVDDDWTPGPVGVVGEKNTSGLHRQASLPTGYHRAFQGARAPKHMPSLNSLSAIAGHEHEEEDWEKEMRGLRNEEELQISNQEHDNANGLQSPTSPLGNNFGHVPSPPIADSGVRRHQSLTAGHGSNVRRSSAGLKRSGTLQTPGPMRSAPQAARSPSPTDAEEGYEDEETPYTEDSYFRAPQQQQQQQQQPGQVPAGNNNNNNNNGYAPSPLSRSPWGTPGEWRAPPTGNAPGLSGHPEELAMDDVSRALSNLELSASGFQGGQSIHPPRFHPMHPPPPQALGMRGMPSQLQQQQQQQGGRKLQLVTDLTGQPVQQGPASAAAYMPAIGQGAPGGGSQRRADQQQGQPGEGGGNGTRRERSYSAHSASGWDPKDHVLGGRTSNPNLKYAYDQGQVPNVPPIPPQYLGQQPQPRLGVTTSFGQGVQGQVGGPMAQGQPMGGVITSPVDIPTLIATKGYNPVNFDTKPPFARFFVIKSYTEDDVHKSIKYEIWSSTDPGNKRLDKAFKETAGRGPIYLLFSVNASGHFCGMAEMLTPVDYTRSSTVWASDKWKGVFKVRWIFVRDIPNAALRHIKLNNTQERKPVTNSRDTQELLPDAGQEMLRIFHTHMARTSLLQDFSYYELQAAQKTQQQLQQSPPMGRIQSPQPPQAGTPQQQLSPTLQPQPQQQQHPFAMANPAALAYAGQLGPMMGVPAGAAATGGMSPGALSAQQYAAAMQGAFRHASPGPPGQPFMGMPGF